MKLYGIGGVGTGKLGNQVFAVKSGTQIVRQYQPVVSNPNTPAQVKTRAKMKLLSQVAAVVSPAIAIPAEGLRTRRNNFISKNYDHVGFSQDKANLNLPDMDLTKGSLFFPYPNLTIAQGQISAALHSEPDSSISKVVFVFVATNAEGDIRLLKNVTVDHVAGTIPTYSFMHTEDTGSIVTCLAYGVRPNNENAKLKLGNLDGVESMPIVEILSSRSLLESDVTFTATAGTFEEVE